MESLDEINNQFVDGVEFCSKAYALFERNRSYSDGISMLRMRSTPTAKRLLEEVLPIYGYVHATYRAGKYISICWVDGDQSFNAKVKATGALIKEGLYPSESYVEVTCSVNPNDYLAGEKLEMDSYYYDLDGFVKNKDRTVTSEAKGYRGLCFIDKDAEYI